MTVCFAQFSFGQSNSTVAIDSTTLKLYGTWYLKYNDQGKYDSLVYTRTSRAPRGYGQRIEISDDGKFVDAYSAPCGNDSAIHHTVGKWTFDSKTKYFETTIPVFRMGNKNKATVLTDTLILFPQH